MRKSILTLILCLSLILGHMIGFPCTVIAADADSEQTVTYLEGSDLLYDLMEKTGYDYSVALKMLQTGGYKIYATRSTAKYLQEHGVNALRVNKITQESPNVMDLILGHKIDLVIDTPTQGNGDKTRDGFLIRRNAIETGFYCITAMDTANALARSLETAMDTLTPIDIAKI